MSEQVPLKPTRGVSSKRLASVAGGAIFYEENQGVVAWGIARSRLSEPDPPVDQGQPPRGDAGRWEFFPEFRSVSVFVSAQAAWQAVQGGLPFVGAKHLLSRVGAIARALGAPAFERAAMRAWLLEKGVVVETDGHVSLATREAESFVDLSARLGMEIDEWDWATLQGDP